MAIERADSIFDIPALKEEYETLQEILKSTQQSIVNVYKTIKDAKNADLGNFADAAIKMEDAFEHSEKKLKESKKAVDDIVKSAKTLLQSNVDISQSYDKMSGTLDQNLKLQLQYKNSLAELRKEQKQLESAYAGSAEAQKQLKDRQLEVYKSIKEIEGANSELTRTIRLQIKEQNAAAGSIDEMKAKYDRLFQVFRGLSEADRNSDIGSSMQADLEALSNSINELQKSAGNFSGNVGRYAESLSKPFELIQNKLQEIRENISKGIGLDGGTDTSSLKRAEEAANALEKGLSDAGKEGASLTSQVKAIDNALSTFITTTTKGDTTNTGFINELGQQLATVKVDIKEAEAITNSFVNKLSKYSGSFAGAFNVLEGELNQVRQLLKTVGSDTPGFDELQRKEKLLTQVTESLTRSFKNPQQELRAFQNATKMLGQEFGITSQEYQEFVQQVGSKKDELEDIQATINFQASDTKYLDGMVSAVNGLAGAYGVAESTSVLFGDSTEELQRSMQKLQAILTLVTSLQAVMNTLQSEGAAAQTLAVARQTLLNTAREIDLALSKKKIVAVEGEAAAQVSNIAATEANAAATAVNAAAQEGYTAATAGAEAATLSLRATLIASGIGLIILGIVAAVAYLVSNMKSWDSEIKENAKNQKEWADDIVATNELISEQTKLTQEAKQASIERMKEELANAEALGISQERSLAMQIKIAEAEKEAANERMRNQPDLIKQLREQEAAYSNLIGKQKEQQEVINELERLRNAGQKTVKGKTADYILGNVVVRNADIDINDAIDAQRKLMDIEKDNLTSTKSSIENLKSIEKGYTEASQRYAQLRLQAAKLAADEARKLALESNRIESDLVIDKNTRILNSEKSTQQQRIDAVKAIAQARKDAALAERNDVLNDPTKSANDKILAEKKYNAEVTKINSDSNEQQYQINESYRKRLLAAQLEFNKIKLEYDKSLSEKLISNDENTFNGRLEAVRKYNEAATEIIDKEYQHTIDTTILTTEERQALDADYNAKKVALAADTQEKVLTILKDQISKEKQILDDAEISIQTLYDSLNSGNLRQYSDDIIALNNSLQTKKISYENYLKEKEKLDFKAAQNELQNQLNLLNQTLGLYKDNTEQIIADKQAISDVNDKIYVAESEAEKNALLEYLSYLKDKLKADEAYAEKRQDIIDEIAKKEAEASNNSTDENKKKVDQFLNDLQGKIQAVGSIIGESISAITNLASIGLDAEQRSVEALEKYQQIHFDEQKKRIERSSMAEEEKTQKIMELEASRQAQAEQNEKRQRQIQRERARYEKYANIASIITSTAAAVVNAYKSVPAPYNIALGAAIGALGLAQLARAVATPLPQYKHGRGFGKEEWAITGDGGVSEYLVREDGSIEKTPPHPTLTHLKPRDRVYKDKDALMRYLALTALPPQLNRRESNNTGISRDDMARFTDNIVGAVEGIRVTTTYITKEGWRTQNRIIQETNDWIERKIKGKR